MRCHAGGIRSALVAWATAVAVFFGSAAPLVAGHEAVDRECAPAAIGSHDHAAHRLSQAPTPAADHCVACHLSRTAGSASAAQAVLPLGLTVTARAQHASDAEYPTDLRTDYTRGPPQYQL